MKAIAVEVKRMLLEIGASVGWHIDKRKLYVNVKVG
jgi:hypothetical protein